MAPGTERNPILGKAAKSSLELAQTKIIRIFIMIENKIRKYFRTVYAW
jgi:hypothetical protein